MFIIIVTESPQRAGLLSTDSSSRIDGRAKARTLRMAGSSLRKDDSSFKDGLLRFRVSVDFHVVHSRTVHKIVRVRSSLVHMSKKWGIIGTHPRKSFMAKWWSLAVLASMTYLLSRPSIKSPLGNHLREKEE
jgi:hypothetical protein